MKVHYRRAVPQDAHALQQVYLASAHDPLEDRLLLKRSDLEKALQSEIWYWMVEENQSSMITGFIYAHLDPQQGLAKLQRLFTLPTGDDQQELNLIRAITIELEADPRDLAMVYATTRTLSRNLQERTLKLGYRVLAVFPAALGIDETGVNGLAAYYFKRHQTLERRQVADALHPLLQVFFEITKQALDLKIVPTLERRPELRSFPLPLPSLELIEAPHFVQRKYNNLRERRFLSHTFYPFSDPNALILDPDQKVEVFVRLVKGFSFATVIAEKLEMPYDPVALYGAIAKLLHKAGYSYVEVLNDACDPSGVEAIYRAGFLPTGYIPAFKKHGEYRRDYVIFANTTERLPRVVDLHPDYKRWLIAYQRSESRAVFGKDNSAGSDAVI